MSDRKDAKQSARDHVMQYLERVGLGVRAIDMLLTEPNLHDDIASALAQCLQRAVRTQDNQPFYSLVRVIVPSGVEWTIAETVGSGSKRGERAFPPIEVHRTRSREIESLAELVLSAPEGAAIACPFLHLYSSGTGQEFEPFHVTTGLFGERLRLFDLDTRVEQELAQIGQLLRAAMGGDPQRHVLCVASGERTTKALEAAFDTLSRIGAPEPSGLALSRVVDWSSELQCGTPEDEVRANIERTVGNNSSANQLLAIALSQAGQPIRAFELLATAIPEAKHHASSDFLAMCARFALEAGDRNAAERLVGWVATHPQVTPSALKCIAQLTRIAGFSTQYNQAVNSLCDLVPNDVDAVELLAENLYETGRSDEAALLLQRHKSRLTQQGQYLLARATSEELDIGKLYHSVPLAMQQRAVAEIVRVSTLQKQWDTIDEICDKIKFESRYAPATVDALFVAATTWLSSDPIRHTLGDSLASPIYWMTHALRLLAQLPSEGELRARIESIWEPDSLGELVSLYLFLQLLQPAVEKLTDIDAVQLRSGDESDASEFLDHFKREFSDRPRVVIVPKRLAANLDKTHAMRLTRGGVRFLSYLLLESTLDASDEKLVLMVLEAVLDIVHTSLDTRTPAGATRAIALVHFAASALAAQGRNQLARDVVESALQIASGTSDLGAAADAWLAMADVRVRVRQPMSALFSLVLAAQVLPQTPVRRSRYHSCAARVLRDLRMYREANEQLTALNEIARSCPSAVDARQANGLRWSLAVAQAAAKMPSELLSDTEESELSTVVREAFAESSEDTASADRTVAAVHLALAVRILREHARPIPIEQSAIDLRLAVFANLDLLRGVVSSVPTIEDVRDSIDVSGHSRYREDFVQDTHVARVIARRVLAHHSTSVAGRAAAIETLSDLELSFRSGAESRESPGFQRTMPRLFEFARDGKSLTDLIRMSGDVLQTGTNLPLREVLSDPDGFLDRLTKCGRSGVLIEATSLIEERLAHLRVQDGRATWSIEPDSVFAGQRLFRYRQEYPYAYHRMDEYSFNPEHEVAQTLVKLGVSSIESTVRLRCLVTDSQLSCVPANLQPVGDVFGGDLIATVTAPSLGSLLVAYESRNNPLAWDASAWVLREKPGEFPAPLTIVADQFESELRSFEVRIARDVGLRDVQPSAITWLVAHGGLGIDSRHLARVSDDIGSYHSLEDVVAACRGASVVVLLVCSGSRVSSGLFAERMHGLPNLLLRSGIRTVIGSPWPIDVFVATKWSEELSKQLRSGEIVAEAVFRSNQKLSNRHPKHRLAMHVYGDPWLHFRTVGGG